MDYSAIKGMMASLKAATDISKALFELKVTAEVQGKVIELQSALMSAQSSAHEAMTSQYTLVCLWRGSAQVYALEKERGGGVSSLITYARTAFTIASE